MAGGWRVRANRSEDWRNLKQEAAVCSTDEEEVRASRQVCEDNVLWGSLEDRRGLQRGWMGRGGGEGAGRRLQPLCEDV